MEWKEGIFRKKISEGGWKNLYRRRDRDGEKGERTKGGGSERGKKREGESSLKLRGGVENGGRVEVMDRGGVRIEGGQRNG